MVLAMPMPFANEISLASFICARLFVNHKIAEKAQLKGGSKQNQQDDLI
jgi:hypothetical protein